MQPPPMQQMMQPTVQLMQTAPPVMMVACISTDVNTYVCTYDHVRARSHCALQCR